MCASASVLECMYALCLQAPMSDEHSSLVFTFLFHSEYSCSVFTLTSSYIFSTAVLSFFPFYINIYYSLVDPFTTTAYSV